MGLSAAGEVYEVARAYYRAWREGQWDELRALLAPDVRFEAPPAAPILGADQHVALYREHRRFPDLSDLTFRRFVSSADAALISYDAWFLTHSLLVFDEIEVRQGRIARVTSASANWPPASERTT